MRAPLFLVRLAVVMAASVWRDCLRFVAGFCLILAVLFGLCGLVVIAYYVLASGLFDSYVYCYNMGEGAICGLALIVPFWDIRRNFSKSA